MTGSQNDVREFLAALEETPELWRSMDIRVIAVSIDAEWHNVLTRCRIDSRSSREIPSLKWLPDGELLTCLHEVRDVADLNSFLGEVESGAFSISGRRIHVKELSDAMEPTGSSYQYGDARLGSRVAAASRVHRPQEFRAHTLTISSSRSGRHLTDLAVGGSAAIARFLRSLDHPWDGIDGLARVALSSRTEPSRTYQPLVELVAPLGVAFDTESIRLKSGWLTVVVFAESLEAGKRCSVGCISEHSDGSYNTDTLPLKIRRSKGKLILTAVAKANVGDARKVTLLLRVGPHLVETQEVEPTGAAGENRQALSYLFFDPALKKLKEVLGRPEAEAIKRREGAQEFEIAVARLLSLAGLWSDALDSLPGLQDAVDIVATAPNGMTVLAVECTLGALNTGKGKPGKLVNRVHQLREHLLGTGAEVLPIMASCRRRSGLSTGDLNYVAGDGIAVLGQDDLLEIAHGIEYGWGVDETLAFCRRRIPTAKSSNRNQLSEDVEG